MQLQEEGGIDVLHTCLELSDSIIKLLTTASLAAAVFQLNNTRLIGGLKISAITCWFF